MADADFFRFLLAVYQNLLSATKPGGAIYVCHADSEGANFRRAMTEAGWLLKQCLIWVKQTFVLGRQDYHWRHEPILYGWAPGASHYFTHDRTRDTVIDDTPDFEKLSKAELLEHVRAQLASSSIWHEDRPQTNDLHPTMKPVPLVERAIRNSSRPGEVVLDLFSGGGSMLVAAEQTGRVGYAMELAPKFVAVGLERLAGMGLEPRLVD